MFRIDSSASATKGSKGKFRLSLLTFARRPSNIALGFVFTFALVSSLSSVSSAQESCSQALLLQSETGLRLLNKPLPAGVDEIQRAPSPSLGHEIRLLSWNIQKGSGETKWAEDFASLANSADLVLLQEGLGSKQVLSALKNHSKMSWLFGKSWKTSSGFTGVITGAKANPSAVSLRVSPDREPIANTPKVSLITKYEPAGSLPLMVINVHAINFVSNQAFARQMKDVFDQLRNWPHNVVLAGDFNTWNAGRREYLIESLKKLGFDQVEFSRDPRYMVLDHVFTKGCKAVASEVLGQISSSDHYPLMVRMICP